MQARFARNEAVGLYPEGTTSDGLGLLPFRASLFEPAHQHGVTIQPVALVYGRDGDRKGFPAFVGDKTLVANVIELLAANEAMTPGQIAKALGVRITVAPPAAAA